jgi:hypothetical protein
MISLSHMVGSLKMNTALEYSTRVVQEGDRRCKKSTLNYLTYLTPLRIPLMNPVIVNSVISYPPPLRVHSNDTHTFYWGRGGTFNFYIFIFTTQSYYLQSRVAWAVYLLPEKSSFHKFKDNNAL